MFRAGVVRILTRSFSKACVMEKRKGNSTFLDEFSSGEDVRSSFMDWLPMLRSLLVLEALLGKMMLDRYFLC